MKLTTESINVFIDNINTPQNSADPLEDFVVLYNQNFTPPITNTDDINDIVDQISTNQNILVVINTLFLKNDFDNLESVLTRLIGPAGEKELKSLIIPQIKASINDVSVGIEFPTNILQPLDQNNNPLPAPAKVVAKVGLGALKFDSERGVVFDEDIVFNLPKSGLLNLGFFIEASNVKLLISKDSQQYNPCVSSYPPDLKGVFIESAIIGFPKFWQKDDSKSNAEIFGTNLLIGTGGLSGTIGLHAKDPNGGAAPLLHTHFGGTGDNGFEISLDSFDLTFQQNSIIHSNINGQLALPAKFKSVGPDGKPINARVVLGVAVAIGNGDFSITAKPLVTPLMFNIANVANFTVRSMSVGKEDDRYYIEASGKIKIVYDTPPFANFLPEAIDIQCLRIWTDGQIELRGTGGEFKLRKPISLRFPPVELSITAISLGSYEGYHGGIQRKYLYFGFDGSVSINPGGISGKGSGIKFYFTHDNDEGAGKPLHVFMRIQTIEIDLILPDGEPALLLQGILSMRDPDPTSEFPDPGPEYIGSVTFELPKIKMGGSAGMRLNPRVPAFLIDVSLEMSTPIILGATGLGIYGFRGLFGKEYIASKEVVGLTEEARWFDYYKKKVPPINKEGVDIGKFDLKKKGISIGVGVSLATSSDQGRAFSSKLFLLLSLPNAFLLQGQAQILKKQRLQLNDPSDPPFSLMLAVDNRSLSVTIGVNFLVPNDPESPDDAGKILTGFGEFDFAFFWKDPSAWYMNFGTDLRPIQANVLNLFRAYAFLMLSGRGIKFGAGFSLDKSVNCGPMKIKLWAILDIGSQISFKPVQFGGFLALSGGVSIKIFGFGFGLSVKAGLAGEAPKPFIITGMLAVCVYVLRKERCGSIELTWQFKKTPQTDPLYFITETGKGNAQVAKAVNMLTGEGFSIYTLDPDEGLPNVATLNAYVLPVIPVDSFIDIEFNKGVMGGVALGNKVGGYRGGVAAEYIPPVKGKSKRIKHNYIVENIEIHCHDGTQWKPYDIYDALTPWDTAPFIKTTDTSTYPIGYWQLDSPGRVNKLSIMATTPVRFLRNANVVYEDLGVSVEHLLCEKKLRTQQCASVSDKTLGSFAKNKTVSLNTGVKLKVFNTDGKIISFANVFNEAKGLQLMPGSYAELYLPEPSPIANLKLSALTDTVNITYYSLSETGAYTEIKRSLVPQSNLIQPVVYEDKNNPVWKIRIEPGACSRDDTGLTCGLPLPESALLLNSLNAMASANALATGDPYNGARLYLDKQIQSSYLPSGYDPCQLHLEVQQYLRRRWTFIVNRSLNPGGLRTGTLKIGKKTIPFAIPAFDITNPLNDPQVIINAMKAVFVSTKKFNIISQTANTLTIEAKDPNTDIVSIPLTNAFTHFLAPDSGRAFNYQNILSFSNIRPDADSKNEGLNYTFIVDAALTGGDIVAVKGRTDKFPTVCCNGVTSRYVATTCTQTSARLKELHKYRDTLLTEYAYEQKLCSSLSQNISCQAESLPHCNRVTQIGLILQSVNGEITSLNTYLSTHCSSGGDSGGSICTTNVSIQSCSIVFYKICWMKEMDYLYNSGIPDYQMLLNDTTALVSRFEKTIQPIWRPGTKYAIHLSINDRVGTEGTYGNDNPQKYTYLFQTKGPIGHFHQYRQEYIDLTKKNQQDQFKLADLRHYVDLTRSYPNADGNLLSAKPLYFADPKLFLFFKREYVYAMYQGYASYQGLPAIESAMNKMVVTIKDPSVSDFAVPLDGNEALWDEDKNSVLPRDIRAILNMVNSHDACMDIDLSRPKGVHLEIAPPELKPLKLYSALYYSEYTPANTFGPTEVLTYNFQTSRYRSFREHIASHILIDEDDPTITKKAVFDVKLRTFTPDDHTNAQQIIDGTMPSSNPLLTTFMHPYDRLVDGVFKLNLPAAVHLEFNIIRDYSLGNTDSDTIIGILLRSPEPFNDPKIPMDRLKDAIRILLPDGTANPSYTTILYSKDISSVFISTASLNITDVDMVFNFEYLTYGKDGFVVQDQVTVAIVTPASVSKLAGTDCGRTEVNFTDVLKAVPVKDAVLYQFLIERPAESFSQTYTDVAATALFPLGEISGLDYNRSYSVKIKTFEKEALTGIERLSSYGPACTIVTRKLRFLLPERAQKYQYVNEPLTLPVNLLFNNGSRFAYNGNVTVTATGSTTGDGVVALTDGAGNVILQNTVPENVQIGFSDSANTGYDVSYEDHIQLK